MAYFVLFLSVLVFSEISKVNGETVSLICPLDYKPTSQGWYAEAPDDNFTPGKDFTKELNLPTSAFRPSIFSVCAICNGDNKSPEVEICIENKALRSRKLVYGRSPSDAVNDETLVWSKTKNLSGLEIDMSKKDLLETLQSIKPISNASSPQSRNLNCPDGFQLERFEMRSPFKEGKDNRPCILCSNDHHLSSSCTCQNKPKYLSLLLPSLYSIKGDCPSGFRTTEEGCQLDVYDLTMKDKLCYFEFRMDPGNFMTKHKDMKANNVKLDCSKSQSECKLKSLFEFT